MLGTILLNDRLSTLHHITRMFRVAVLDNLGNVAAADDDDDKDDDDDDDSDYDDDDDDDSDDDD